MFARNIVHIVHTSGQPLLLDDLFISIESPCRIVGLITVRELLRIVTVLFRKVKHTNALNKNPRLNTAEDGGVIQEFSSAVRLPANGGPVTLRPRIAPGLLLSEIIPADKLLEQRVLSPKIECQVF